MLHCASEQCFKCSRKSKETNGNAITHPQSHPVQNSGMGWNCMSIGNGCFFERWSTTGHH